jgi:hypothetical protein
MYVMKRSRKISDGLSAPKHYPMKRNAGIAKCILTLTVGEEEWPITRSGSFTAGEAGLLCPKTRLITVAKRKFVTPLGIEELQPLTETSPALHKNTLAILRQQQNKTYRVMQNPFHTRC